MQIPPVTSCADAERKPAYKQLVARAPHWTESERRLFEQVVLERVRRDEPADWIRRLGRGSG